MGAINGILMGVYAVVVKKSHICSCLAPQKAMTLVGVFSWESLLI